MKQIGRKLWLGVLSAVSLAAVIFVPILRNIDWSNPLGRWWDSDPLHGVVERVKVTIRRDAPALAALGGPGENWEFIFHNQGNRDMFINDIRMIQLIGPGIPLDKCATPRALTLVSDAHYFKNQWFGEKDWSNMIISVADPDSAFHPDSVDAQKTRLFKMAFSMTPLQQAQIQGLHDAMFCPVIDFTSFEGTLERAICPGWANYGSYHGDHVQVGIGPVKRQQPTALMPSEAWPEGCVLTGRRD